MDARMRMRKRKTRKYQCICSLHKCSKYDYPRVGDDPKTITQRPYLDLSIRLPIDIPDFWIIKRFHYKFLEYHWISNAYFFTL